MADKKTRIIVVVVAIMVIVLGIILGIILIKNNKKSYDIEVIKTKDYYTILSQGKVGVINKKGEVLIEPIYDDVQIPNPLKPVFICLSNYKKETDTYNVTIKNDKNEDIFKQYDEVSSIQANGLSSDSNYVNSALKYKVGSLYGLLGFDGKEITKAIYEEIDSLPYKEEEFLVKKEGKYGVINQKGAEMLKAEYDEISGDGYYDNNYKNAGYIAGIKEDNGYTYSYIRNDGKVILKREYNDIARITEIEGNDKIYLIASKEGKKGLFVNNKNVLECDYQNIEYNEESKLLIVKRNDKYGVYDLNGNVILPTENSEVSINGIRIVTTNNGEKTEYNSSGIKIRDNKYKYVSATDNSEFFITVNENNLYGLMNSKGTEVIENKYKYLEYLSGNYFIAYSDENKIGVLDSDGKLILDMKYDVIQKIKGSKIIQAIQLGNKNIELYSENMTKIVEKENATIFVYDEYIKLASRK